MAKPWLSEDPWGAAAVSLAVAAAATGVLLYGASAAMRHEPLTVWFGVGAFALVVALVVLLLVESVLRDRYRLGFEKTPWFFLTTVWATQFCAVFYLYTPDVLRWFPALHEVAQSALLRPPTGGHIVVTLQGRGDVARPQFTSARLSRMFNNSGWATADEQLPFAEIRFRPLRLFRLDANGEASPVSTADAPTTATAPQASDGAIIAVGPADLRQVIPSDGLSDRGLDELTSEAWSLLQRANDGTPIAPTLAIGAAHEPRAGAINQIVAGTASTVFICWQFLAVGLLTLTGRTIPAMRESDAERAGPSLLERAGTVLVACTLSVYLLFAALVLFSR